MALVTAHSLSSTQKLKFYSIQVANFSLSKMAMSCLQPLFESPSSLLPISFLGSSSFSKNPHTHYFNSRKVFSLEQKGARFNREKRGEIIACGVSLLPVEPWVPSIDPQSIASQLFAFSLFPYFGFLYFITKSKSALKLTLFGFCFLLAFVGATRLRQALRKSISDVGN